MELYEQMHQKMEEGEEEELVALVRQCLEQDYDIQDIVQKGLISAMDEIGVKFRADELFFPEVLLSASCMHAAMEVLRPHIVKADIKAAGKFLIGTVAEDVHDIGKNLVSMNVRAAGFDVVDLGVEVPPEGFVDAIREHKPDIVGVSALLTTTMVHMEETVKAIDESSLREEMGVKVIVGGAPVDKGFADEIGSDYYGDDAIEAVTIAGKIMNQKREASACTEEQ